ncbi:hypothetical protein F5Y12DRAFT_712564 [Xylaria sp. FL1777]|nr:hypothetical protein F5Y12DRAFT_712564 [Xylaria sp. FL1777]
MDLPKPSGSCILQLPYELLLAIFHQLPDQSSINALATAHPAMAVVHRENEKSIRKAMRYNFMAEVARKATGYGSLELVRFCLAMESFMHAMYLTVEPAPLAEILSKVLSPSWVISNTSLHWVRSQHMEATIRAYYNGAWDLEFLGFFDLVPDLDRWYNERFLPVNNRDMYMGTALETHRIMYGNPVKVRDVGVLMVIEFWCNWWAWSHDKPCLPEYLKFFSPEIAVRVKHFARCFMKARHHGAMWEKFYVRNLRYIFFFSEIKALRALSGISPEEDPIDAKEAERG